MILKEYKDRAKNRKLRQETAITEMSLSRLNHKTAKDRGYDNLTEWYKEDYTHYRDIAIKEGADISGLPKKLK